MLRMRKNKAIAPYPIAELDMLYWYWLQRSMKQKEPLRSESIENTNANTR